MLTITVPVVIEIIAHVTVEAKTIKEAIEMVEIQGVHLSNLCGNGGTDKIIGTSMENVSLTIGEHQEVIEDAIEWDKL